MTTSPSHQLTAGRPLAGLLAEPRELRVKRLVDTLWLELRKVRRDKTPEALRAALQLSRELLSLGYLPIIIQKGRITGAHDTRMDGRPIHVFDEEDNPKEKVDTFLQYQELKRQLEMLDPVTKARLIRELRMARRKEMTK